MEACGAVTVTTTWPDRESALEAGRLAVAGRLAACSQVGGPVTSIYTWKGALERQEEWVLRMKTLEDRLGALEEFVRRIHPYEVPEIVAERLSGASGAYLGWMRGVLGEVPEG